MGYVGGLGAGKGWRRFRFLIAPDELKGVLARCACELLVINSRVPVEYQKTELAEYISRYTSRYSNPRENGCLSDLHTALLLPGTRFNWEPVVARRKKHEGFKVIDLFEPVVTVASLHVCWGADCRFHFAWCTQDPIWIGLDIQFPKVVTYTHEHHEVSHPTEETRNAALFDSLCRDIRRITRPALFASPVGDRKADLRVSVAAAELIREDPRLMAQGIRLLKPTRI
jgi:hypothetical protein